ncbi:MAG: hypothetical protein FJW54_00110 [Actinobacteria bacterium]|nr:hypothetical protein [Actinomycetota bacterium]
MRSVKVIVAILLSTSGIIIAAQSLSQALQVWALLLLALSLTSLLLALIAPLFIKRMRDGRKRSGLPSRYEREKDPWRALSAGEDPTER